jgi:hypothetical protein
MALVNAQLDIQEIVTIFEVYRVNKFAQVIVLKLNKSGIVFIVTVFIQSRLIVIFAVLFSLSFICIVQVSLQV